MADVDFSTWLTKQQAADRLGVSTKTVEQFAKDRKLEQAVWRRPTGGPPLAVFCPEDVDRIALERQPAAAPFVLPAVPAAASRNGNHRPVHPPSQSLTVPTVAPAGEDLVREFLHGLLRAATAPTSQNSEKLFLTIPEAAAVSGFSQAYLRRKCQAGWSGAIKDVAWKIRRKDLEGL